MLLSACVILLDAVSHQILVYVIQEIPFELSARYDGDWIISSQVYIITILQRIFISSFIPIAICSSQFLRCD